MHIILGGTGLVGLATARALLKRGEPVTIVTRDAVHGSDLRDAGARIAVADIRDIAGLREVFRTGTRAFLLNPPADPSGDKNSRGTHERRGERGSPGRVGAAEGRRHLDLRGTSRRAMRRPHRAPQVRGKAAGAVCPYCNQPWSLLHEQLTENARCRARSWQAAEFLSGRFRPADGRATGLGRDSGSSAVGTGERDRSFATSKDRSATRHATWPTRSPTHST